MCSLLLLTTLLLHKGLACISSAPRQFVAPAQPQYYYQPSYQYGVPQFAAPNAGGGGGGNAYGAASGARLAAAGSSNVEPLQPIATGGQSEHLFGPQVTLSEFSSSGYNSEGGGPGNACCWANVPSPDDQIDWQRAAGVPQSQMFKNISIDGHYLVAYASGAAPSDEAHFASCAIGCASSPIRVRAKHWQSTNVLLQVCQRESFPNSVNYNPLLNCQEFPMVPNGVGYTELMLPKASLVDIVFVASNFVNENGDIAVLDNIQTDYDSNPTECGGNTGTINTRARPETTNTIKHGSGITGPETAAVSTSGIDGSTAKENAEKQNKNRAGAAVGISPVDAASGNGGSGAGGAVGIPTVDAASGNGGAGGTVGSVDGAVVGSSNVAGSSTNAINTNINSGSGATAGGTRIASGNSLGAIDSNTANTENSGTLTDFESLGVRRLGTSLTKNSNGAGSEASNAGSSSSASSASSAASSASSSAVSSSSSSTSTKTETETKVITEIRACQTTKCTFEDDTYDTESIRGLTTRFQVVKGQFMNRVTGVREGTEGNYYAATFLYPREKAGLSVDVDQMPQDRRLRFQYYEGTHGVQLKGCCDSVEVCPFSSDKFVTVSDRMWKFGSFSCPRGTQKVFFLCENTRTNQGACAVDDIQVVENRESITLEDKPLC